MKINFFHKNKIVSKIERYIKVNSIFWYIFVAAKREYTLSVCLAVYSVIM